MNCWAVTLELDARTPHIHDVAKNLHNVTKNKVMEMRIEALSSWTLDLKSFAGTGKPARRRCPAEGAASCQGPSQPGRSGWRGLERERGTARSQHRRRQPSIPPGNVSRGSLVPRSPLGLHPTAASLSQPSWERVSWLLQKNGKNPPQGS